jgi:hypothetical protein
MGLVSKDYIKYIMDKISEHITYEEATKSYTALKYGIDNIPNEDQLKNMILLAEAVFEPLRTFIGVPIGITSFFRSKALNSKLKGSRTSQHMANNGAAIDLDASIYGRITNLDIFYYIKENLEFDQLIAEHPDEEGNPAWIHVSYKEKNNRKQVFVSQFNNHGKVIYIKSN